VSETIEIHILDLGELSCPGVSVYGGHPGWERFHKPDSDGLVRFPTRALLARFPTRIVLVDCGYGVDFSDELANEFRLTREPFLARALDGVGLDSADVTDVVFTHSHFDHVSGATHQGTATFPKARHHIQEAAWIDAPDHQWKEDLPPSINLLHGDTELFPGLRVILTGGHSAGHQAVLIQNTLFLADICPTTLHQEIDCVMDYDVNPDVTMAAKSKLLAQSIEQGWTVVFSHDPERASV
jgi:glyoxylase-like metal-dependent hydrolase (beta-lactamase superfamily II)